MKNLFFYLLVCPLILFAQENFLSQSGSYHDSNISVDWSLGELVTETIESVNGLVILTQGMQQSPNDQTLNYPNNNESQSLIYYPNPVTKQVNITFDNKQYHKYLFIGVLGETVQQGILENTHNSLDIEKLASGIYFLKIFNKENQIIQTIKIIKK